MIRDLCFILTLSSTSVFCQGEIVDANNVNQAILNKHVLQEVNALRSRKRIDTLIFDRALLNASQDHADYMAEEEVLTHIQKISDRREPIDRVKFYSGTHGLVAENVQVVDVNKLLKKAKNKLTYIKLAKEIVTVWKKSKTHNANMINPAYAGVANTYRYKDGALYCCQLLASKPFKDHYRYSPAPDLFVKNKKECRPCKRVKKKIYRAEVNLGWYTVSNDSIYYRNTAHYMKYRWYNKKKNKYRISSRKNNLNKIFKAKGVLTMDLIHHRQIDCAGNSSFHNSLYHDGYYLDFLTKKRILEDDLDPNKELIKVYVGMKPTFKDTFFQVDFHYMKRWRPCMQNSTIFVSPDHLLPREYFRIPKPTIVLDKNLIIEDSIMIRIPFKRNQTSEDTSIFQPLIVSMDSLVKENREIQKISFTGVASIEGSEKSNEKLFLRRGKIIEDYLRRYYREISFEKRFFENFDDFRSGLTSLRYQDLVGFSDDSLRIFA
ncbi:CAP domain-containing protein, partial [Crocinitomix catalasitica]|nr:CAP domain-containing protein [Crocinitomix catalasitica]